MNRQVIYLSTIAPNADELSRRYDLGVEIAEYCTAWNMDEKFEEMHSRVLEKIDGIPNRALHAPFNELFPCAIDPKARELAAYRYRQAIALAKQYGATKVIIHGGYNPWIYYPIWYIGESVKFWQDFLKEDPRVEIVLENVLETDPAWLLDIVKGVNDPRLRLCLDVGHVNAYSKIPVLDWLKAWAPYLETMDQNGSKQLLSQTLNTKSGGETQTPFYIAVLASFAQIYQVNNLSGLINNTVRLVVFDEAFNKMDSERIVESVRLLRKMGLQAIICTPPDKLPEVFLSV